MKKALLYPAVLYLNMTYFMLFFTGIFFHQGDNFQSVAVTGKIFLFSWGFFLMALIPAALIAVFDGVRKVSEGDEISLRKYMSAVKFGIIPFFIFNFAAMAFLFLLFTAASRGLGIILFPVPFIITWLLFIPSSVYGISYLFLLRTRGTVSFGFFILNSIMQMCFVIDIASVIIVLVKTSRGGLADTGMGSEDEGDEIS